MFGFSPQLSYNSIAKANLLPRIQHLFRFFLVFRECIIETLCSKVFKSYLSHLSPFLPPPPRVVYYSLEMRIDSIVLSFLGLSLILFIFQYIFPVLFLQIKQDLTFIFLFLLSYIKSSILQDIVLHFAFFTKQYILGITLYQLKKVFSILVCTT